MIDAQAATANLRALQGRAGSAELMAIVKAEAYGHGMIPMARVAREAGVTWLGVALPSEALELRAAGDTGRILAWLWAAGDPDIADCVAADVDLSISGFEALDDIIAGARQHGCRARVHLKVDTGLSRNGIVFDDLPAMLTAIAAAPEVELVGIWSHLISADIPGDPSVALQREPFELAISLAEAAGFTGLIRHLASTAALLQFPECTYDLVRIGIGMYGISPSVEMGTAESLGLQPVMTLRVRIAGIKPIAAGESVSYNATWTATAPTILGLIPIGYADGIPRSASNSAHVTIDGVHYPIVGRVAMDQFMIDLGDNPHGVVIGSDAIVFGAGADPVELWAEHSDTIGYEIVTRIAPRVPRILA